MKVIVRRVTLAAALCVVTGSLQAASGVLIVETTTGAGAAPTTNQVQLERNRMRAESTGASGEKQIVIFDGTRQVLMIIDPAKKSYTELTKEEADRLGSQISDAMAQMQKQMAGMPPEQRAQIEAMMKGRMGGAGMPAAPKVEYRKAGTGTVGKWTCDRYEGFEAGQKTSEVCTVAPSVLGVTPADFAVAQQLAEFFGKIEPRLGKQILTIGTGEDQGFSGVPVKRTFTAAGREITSEITAVSRQAFDDAGYAAPAGYEKRPFPGAGRGGR